MDPTSNQINVTCPACGCHATIYCRDDIGNMIPICKADGCVEHTQNDHGYCRDCDIERSLDSMQCSVCTQMRYRTEGQMGEFAASLWGARCVCDQSVPTLGDLRDTPTPASGEG